MYEDQSPDVFLWLYRESEFHQDEFLRYVSYTRASVDTT
jgi:hypothetical protein